MLNFRKLLVVRQSGVPIFDQIVEAAEKIGLIESLFIVFTLFLLWLVKVSMMKAFKAKDAEIGRLRETNDKLEDRLFRFIDRHNK